MKTAGAIMTTALALVLGASGCANNRTSQASSCHGGSCEVPGTGNPFQTGAPSYDPPVYAAPSPAPAAPQGSGTRAAPSYQGSGSR